MIFKTPLDLSIGYQNIEGIHNATFGCKIPYLQNEFIHDIEVISETWGTCDHEKSISGYKFFIVDPHKDKKIKKGRSSGGIIVYYKERLHPHIKRLGTTDHYTWIELSKDIFYDFDEPLKICIAYNPPEKSNYCNKDIYDDLSIHLFKYRSNINTPLILVGDFNSRTGQLLDYDERDEREYDGEGVPSGSKRVKPSRRLNTDTQTNPMGTKLVGFCKSHELLIINGRTPGDESGNFTFFDSNKGASSIDLAIASDLAMEKVKSFNVFRQDEISQHCKIVLRLNNIKPPDNPEKKIKDTYNWILLKEKYVWSADMADTFGRVISTSIFCTPIIEECTQLITAGLIESASMKMAELFNKAAERTLQPKQTRSTQKPPFKHKRKCKKWFDADCTTHRKNTRRLAILKRQRPNDLGIRTEYNSNLKEYKKICRQKKYSFEQRQIEKIKSLTDDPLTFWKEWKQMGDTNKTNDIPENADGKKWELYFKNLFKNNIQDEFTIPEAASKPSDINDPLNKPFSLDELNVTIDKLKNGKAADHDRLINEFLKAAPERIRKLLLSLINTIYRTTIIPKSWCLGMISPVHKDGSKENPDNFRGLCIGSALMKVLCIMMNKRLNIHCQENKLIDKNQIGFTSECGAPDHILTFKSLTNKYVNDQKGGKLYTCFIDLRKAFDTVWHNGLFHKLHTNKVQGNFLQTLRNIYKNSRCSVKVGSKLTQPFKCEKGVRQGDPLSPLLFNLYINGIFDSLREAGCDPVTLSNDSDPINALAYADDLVLISTSKTGLQKALYATAEYCSKWKLEINYKKTKCMTLSKGNQKESTIFKLNGNWLENVKEYKYLGVIIHKRNCSFTSAIKNLRIRAVKACYALNSKVDMKRLPIYLALKIFDTMIKPILLYASEVWAPCMNQNPSKWDYDEIDKTHMQFLKRMLGVNRSTTNILVRGELNRYSLQEEILRRNINFAKHIHVKDSSDLVKQAYTLEQTRGDEENFMNSIRKHSAEIIRSTNSFEPFSDPNENIYKIDKNKLRKITTSIFHTQWQLDLDNSSKSDTYRLFKQHMKRETYLELLNRKERISFTKFRVSDHKLMIEQGRRQKPKIQRENRKCIMCTTEIDNETHFLTSCALHPSRNSLYELVQLSVPTFTDMTDQQKIQYLMTQEDEEITTFLAKYIHKWFQFRQFLQDYFDFA